MDGLLNPAIGAQQYTTFFSEYTDGVQPSDWTSRWAAGSTALVQTVSGSLAGKALRVTKTAAARQGISWDRVPSTADIEVLMRLRAIEAWANNENLMGIIGRGSGASGAENGYRVAPTGITTTTQFSSGLNKYVSGTNTNLGTASSGPSPNLAVNDWIWVRFRVNGTSISRKMWHDGASEPGAVDETVTDSSVAGAGWVGISQVSANPNIEIDFFSVALNGDTALGP